MYTGTVGIHSLWFGRSTKIVPPETTFPPQEWGNKERNITMVVNKTFKNNHSRKMNWIPKIIGKEWQI